MREVEDAPLVAESPPVPPAIAAQVEAYMHKPYHKVLSGDRDDGFLVQVVELPGCMTAAETEAEAFAQLPEAMSLWLETMLLDGNPIPEPGPRAKVQRPAPRADAEESARASGPPGEARGDKSESVGRDTAGARRRNYRLSGTSGGSRLPAGRVRRWRSGWEEAGDDDDDDGGCTGECGDGGGARGGLCRAEPAVTAAV